MMYKVTFSKNAQRQFFELEDKIQERVISVIKRIQIQPHHFCKQMVGSRSYRL